MAIDEAITAFRIDNAVQNTLRLYLWRPSAVSIGRFQDLLKEVHVNDCKQRGVDFVRRITGGGAVYHDSHGEITYSVVARETDFGSTDVVDAYNRICQGLIEAAKILGIHADFNPGDPRNCPNIGINARKISGSAQYHKGGVLLQHGTFLLDVDFEKMFTFLRVPWAKNIEEVVRIAEHRHTSVQNELKRNVSVQEAYEALVQGFEKALNVEFVNEALTEPECSLASKLREERYSRENWNLKGEI